MLAAGESGADECARRRAALAALLGDHLQSLLDTLMPEAVRASGLGQNMLENYHHGARETLPIALRAVAADDRERDLLLTDLLTLMQTISRQRHVPPIVERGLVGLGFRLALTQVRARAAKYGCTADELELELLGFRNAFEEKYK